MYTLNIISTGRDSIFLYWKRSWRVWMMFIGTYYVDKSWGYKTQSVKVNGVKRYEGVNHKGSYGGFV